MKIQKTKIDDQMVEGSGPVSLTEGSIQVKTEGDKVAMPLEDPELLPVPEGDHTGIWSDDVILQPSEEPKGKALISMEGTTHGASSQDIGKCGNTYNPASPAKKQSTTRPTHGCRLCVCTKSAGHTGDHKCSDCGRTWSG